MLHKGQQEWICLLAIAEKGNPEDQWQQLDQKRMEKIAGLDYA